MLHVQVRFPIDTGTMLMVQHLTSDWMNAHVHFVLHKIEEKKLILAVVMSLRESPLTPSFLLPLLPWRQRL